MKSNGKRKLKGQRDRLALFVDGFELLRWLATDEVSKADAQEAGINYREYYRWLNAFRAAGIAVYKTWRPSGRGPGIPCYSISKSELRDLLETKTKKGGQKMKTHSRERRARHGRDL